MLRQKKCGILSGILKIFILKPSTDYELCVKIVIPLVLNEHKLVNFAQYQVDMFGKDTQNIFLEKTYVKLFLILIPYINRDKFEVLVYLGMKVLASALF